MLVPVSLWQQAIRIGMVQFKRSTKELGAEEKNYILFLLSGKEKKKSIYPINSVIQPACQFNLPLLPASHW